VIPTINTTLPTTPPTILPTGVVLVEDVGALDINESCSKTATPAVRTTDAPPSFIGLSVEVQGPPQFPE
jgi:hypothetical protein